MDWFTWLSKAGLEPSLVYEYGLVLAHNELEEEDIAYFNHEFLQSMGICIAKHRLEILKLSKKEKRSIRHPNPMSKLVIAIKRTKRNLSKYIRTWVHREDSSSALAIVPRRSSYNSSSRWKNSMLKRNKKKLMITAKDTGNRLLLTNGSPNPSPSRTIFLPSIPRIESFSTSPMVYDLKTDEKVDADYDDYWSSALEEIRWDTMFQNLKPT